MIDKIGHGWVFPNPDGSKENCTYATCTMCIRERFLFEECDSIRDTARMLGRLDAIWISLNGTYDILAKSGYGLEATRAITELQVNQVAVDRGILERILIAYEDNEFDVFDKIKEAAGE